MKKHELIGEVLGEINIAASKFYILRNRARKLKNMTFLHFMTVFRNFAIKIETS